MFTNLQASLSIIVHVVNFWGVLCAIFMLVVTAIFREGKTAKLWIAIDIICVFIFAGCSAVSIVALGWRVIGEQPWYLVSPQAVYSIVFFVGAGMSLRKIIKRKAPPTTKRRNRCVALSCGLAALVALVGSEMVRNYYLADMRSYIEQEKFSSMPMKCMMEYLLDAKIQEPPRGVSAVSTDRRICEFSDGVVIEVLQDRYIVWRRDGGQHEFVEFNDVDSAVQGARSTIDSQNSDTYYIAIDRKASADVASRVIQALSASSTNTKILMLYISQVEDSDHLNRQHELFLSIKKEMEEGYRKMGPQYFLGGHIAGDWFYRNAVFCNQINEWIRPDWFDRSDQTKEDCEDAISSLVRAIEVCGGDVDFDALKIMIHFLFVPIWYEVQEAGTNTGTNTKTGPPEKGATHSGNGNKSMDYVMDWWF